ncbi:MAG TPA: UDP-N-acetylmuramoyl-L-alanyl-D-glutamate--2,6-diaminopimelate ligase [Tepidisphaeraceae bacterium]|nr:UDP-N-acetylmuramoyl-L-alanyl-D-glutamate--2,6-diaminopimelate ligase [Tepidisphaeraceae bacterium]
MQLHELIRQFDPSISLKDVTDVAISGLQEDSRLIKPGDLFIARGGTKIDGSQFIANAVAQGAAAVVTAKSVDGLAVPQVVTSDPSALSRLANLFYGEPSKDVRVLAVTGTNGKTTTTYLIRHILAKAGIQCGVVGTVEIDDGKTQQMAEMTTPGAIQVAQLLAAMRDNGCKACAIETSSHALHQGRVAGVQFAAAGFTNLTGDHLDYHQTKQDYADAKARLFGQLAPEAAACLNRNSEWTARMMRDTKGRIITWGISDDADYRAQDLAITSNGSHFVLVTPDGQAEIHMPLIGKYNVENALCAASMVSEVFGLTVHQIAAAMTDAHGAPGRLQAVRGGQPFAVLVDYAHTDDALENVLNALRPLTKGKLRVLFGCGGDRDRTKRPRMAATAQRLADVIYVTSDNPRTENAQAIIDEILTGFSADNGKTIVIEPDRHQAIEKIVGDAQENDVVLLAGKGHEDYQIIGKTKFHFDDVEEAMKAIKAKAKMGV